MALNLQGPVSQIFKKALREPDGIAAYVVSGFSVALTLIGFFSNSLDGELPLFQRIQENRWLFVFMPLVMLVSYAWLNDISAEYEGKHWTNAGLILLAAGVFLWRPLLG